MDHVEGILERITFQNPENFFTVAKLGVSSIQDLITLVGIMPNIQLGETVICQGIWKNDPKHGKQFAVETFQKKAPTSILGIQKYLSSNFIKGIGPKFAEKIVKKFGEKTLEIIEKTPKKLLEVEGLGEKKLAQIIESAQAHKTIEEVMVFLQSHSISSTFAQKIYKNYKDKSQQVLQENPYVLARDLRGVGFKMADKIALSMGIAKDSPARIAAAIEHLLYEYSSNGHTCFPKNQLILVARELLGADSKIINETIYELNNEKRVVLDFIEKEEFVWLKPLQIAEQGISQEIYRLLNHPSTFREVKLDKALLWVEDKLKIRFAKKQKEAIESALVEKLLIITGGPGTGKSTITKAILKILSLLSKRIILAAPTGRAAKRMTEITYWQASTIHSLLEYDFKVRKFRKNQENPLTVDLLILDEASMVDTYLMHQLLRAIPNSARVILVGDVDQLPSVGPGNVLRDLINSKIIPTQTLKYIFRQGKGSKIVQSAHAVNSGFFPKLTSNADDDFFFIEAKESQEVLEKILEQVTNQIPNKYGFNSKKDIQVLAPMRKGYIGTENLNQQLQKTLNTQQNGVMSLGHKLLVGDKVMQIKNNYQKEVFNGDVGFITKLDKEEQSLIVSFEGKEVIYEYSELDEITLAYAVSIHKYQGSEAPCIVMPIHTHHFKLLCRNLLYTGITRGKKLVILVGTKKALAIAINNNEIEKRFTALTWRLVARQTLTA